ncbi:Toxoplasma gondii family B protein [Toxoplasma gondii ME49]|uniref:Toxoplasma gondii family B protein n=10 Tax=Toxoplasma gondii TaxID=5811 RepID=S7UGM7_TOXGG|nr:Toxoplasma gondii family B protein [Toxoplasma gondii ME49]EPR57256.1 Toxoplasma gondii family B protein [Toxoplasma gondii GT1]KAF4644008.1 Toxoplasma gondii family B protein [Toxoplasma gondii]KFG42567.1 Toxoplasma gondii family B protein [Toxoplasma gondii FOU]KFG59001.1 Toxoplasma gondii family B protein [Toxoplasma gondii RUB]KFH01587.1 Toxoplasma gondii family B protein [Toxoplasma gondii VAND]KFH13593.1 Toxoplasma gondii family B protein [Toxoplasma gondii MAS]KYF45660.1 Toxoplasma|eukprot:XP_018636202.1 Toxoplasma gondii family B protein [Toxoplasma gondii ME49]
MVNPFSAAALVCFTLFLYEGLGCCTGSRAIVTEVLESVPAINETNVKNGETAVSSSARLVTGNQLGGRGGGGLKKSGRKSHAKETTAPSRRSTQTIAATVGVLLASVFGLLLASAKLMQCPQGSIRGDAEGNTRRRLAEGGYSGEKCVS